MCHLVITTYVTKVDTNLFSYFKKKQNNEQTTVKKCEFLTRIDYNLKALWTLVVQIDTYGPVSLCRHSQSGQGVQSLTKRKREVDGVSTNSGDGGKVGCTPIQIEDRLVSRSYIVPKYVRRSKVRYLRRFWWYRIRSS